MDSVYLVLGYSSGELPYCELFSDPNIASTIALSAAQELAKDTNWVQKNPPALPLTDGSIQWTYLDTSKNFVCLRFMKVKEANSGPMVNNMPSRFSLNDCHQKTPLPVDRSMDPADLSLPGGFSYNNHPLTMEDIKNDPWGVKPTTELTGHQKAALVTARIRKMPNNKWNLFGKEDSLNQKEVLVLLEKNNSAQELDELISMECLVLDIIYSNFMTLKS